MPMECKVATWVLLREFNIIRISVNSCGGNWFELGSSELGSRPGL